MRNKFALSKNREEVWKSIALLNNVLEPYTLEEKSYLNKKGSSTDGGLK